MDTSAITGGPLAIEYALQNITEALQRTNNRKTFSKKKIRRDEYARSSYPYK